MPPDRSMARRAARVSLTEVFDIAAALDHQGQKRRQWNAGEVPLKIRDANRPMGAQPRSLLDPTGSLGLATWTPVGGRTKCAFARVPQRNSVHDDQTVRAGNLANRQC